MVPKPGFSKEDAKMDSLISLGDIVSMSEYRESYSIIFLKIVFSTNIILNLGNVTLRFLAVNDINLSCSYASISDSLSFEKQNIIFASRKLDFLYHLIPFEWIFSTKNTISLSLYSP